MLRTDLLRSEAKMDALSHPDPHALFSYARGPDGEILAEERDEVPGSKEEGEKAWRWEMTMRFLKGEDGEFDYAAVDENEEFDDQGEEQEKWFDEQEPEWVDDEKDGDVRERLTGQTGIQDF